MNRTRKSLARVLSLGAFVTAAWLAAQGSGRGAQDSQQVWLINSRSAPQCGDLEAGRACIEYWRLDPANPCQWLPADADAFHESGDPGVPTTFFVHGNRADADQAIEEGWFVYRRMVADAAGRPFRFVIWSWPSDRMARRNRQDVRIKAAESDAEAYYLAHCLSGMMPGEPVSLIGYSFGARVTTGALHLLAGGCLAGHRLPVEPGDEGGEPVARPIRVMLVAAAIDTDWLVYGHRNGLALSQVERMFVTQNPCDRALRWYPRIDRRRGPQAMGYVGPLCGGPPGFGCDKLEAADVSCFVGRPHDWRRYQAAPAFVQRLAWYTFLEPDEGPGRKDEE